MSAQTMCPDADRLLGMLDCELEQVQQLEVTEHVNGCDTCQSRLETLVTSGLREDLEFGKLASYLRKDQQELDFVPGDEEVGRMTETLLNGGANRCATISLDFLEPSKVPNGLGRLGQYEITEVIGRGGMGIALKAHDTRLDRVVAVKVLAPELASNPTARRRFLREARAAAAVSHDHVVTVHAVEPGDLPYLAMEYIDGYSLQQKIDRNGPLEVLEILRIGMQTAYGLAAAHAQGLIHHDIKPANILLQNGIERVQITDFGLARAVDDVTITRDGEIRGTPQYMSPEQAQGNPTDPRSDLFSLGGTLYAMCTGRAPFRADSTMGVLHRVCHDTPRPIREVNPDIPVWLVAIIDHLLEKNPDDRIQTATEVADLLSQYLAHVQQPIVVPLPDAVLGNSRIRTRVSGRPRWYIGVILLAIVFGSMALTEATGVTHVAATVIRIAMGEGTLVIEVDDPTIEISLGGEQLTITGAGIKELKLRPGQYKFTATKDGQPLKSELVSIVRNGRLIVRVSKETLAATKGQTDNPPAVSDDAITEINQIQLDPKGSYVHDLAFSANGAELFCGRAAYYVESWNLQNSHLAILKDENVGEKFAMSTKKNRLVTISYVHDRIVLFDLNNLRMIRTFVPSESTNERGPRLGYADVAISPDGRYIAGASYNQGVRVWAAETGQQIHHFHSDGWVTVVEFSPDSKNLLMAVVSPSKLVQLVDMKTGEDVWRFDEEDYRFAAAFSPSGRWLLLTYGSHGFSLRDAATGREIRNFWANDFVVESFQFLPDSRHFLTGSRDRTMRLWSVESGREISRVTTTDHSTTKIAVSPDGHYAASAGGYYRDERGNAKDTNLVIRLWQLPESVWPQQTASDRPEPGAFVVLNSRGQQAEKFDTLSDALLGSSTGDTIEIRGNGPFMIEPLRIDHSLAIRAGEGFEPVIRCNLDAELSRQNPLIDQCAPLVLEGIHIDVSDSANDEELSCAIVARAPLKIANCQINAANDGFGVWSQGDCEIVNSRLMARADAVTLLDNDGQRQTAALRNCVVTSIDIASIGHRQIDLALESNTFCNDRWLLKVWPVQKSAQAFDEIHRTESLRIRSGDNVFEVGAALLDIQVPEELKDSFKVDSAISWLHDTVDWHDARSLLAGSGPLVRVSRPVETGEFEWIEVLSRLPEWNAIWDQDHAISEVSVVRFQGGDLKARIAHDMARLTPSDFRLRPDSAGYRTGPDGQDLGANIDFVGPGEAYERWKKTDEYQKWLRDARELKQPESTESAAANTPE